MMILLYLHFLVTLDEIYLHCVIISPIPQISVVLPVIVNYFNTDES
jgi:hypothetical protein